MRWAAVFPAVLLIAAIVRAQPEGTYRVYRFGIPVAELTISPEPDGEVRYLLAQRDRASGVWTKARPLRIDSEADRQLLPPTFARLLRHWPALARIDFRAVPAVGWPDADTIYRRHRELDATIDGRTVTAIHWAEHDASRPLDLVVGADNALLAALDPGGEAVLARRGFEALTPVAAWREPGVAQPAYGVGAATRHRVEMRDGIGLTTLVYLPRALAGREGEPLPERWPSILVRTPYGLAGLVERYWQHVARGYAVVLQSTRGRAYWDAEHRSEGEWELVVREPEDGADTLEWIVAQPWSDGRIGMQGGSYVGYTQWAATMADNPALQCIVPEVSMGTAWSDQPFMGGSFVSGLAYYMFWMLDHELQPGRTWAEVLRYRPLVEIDSYATGHDLEPWNRVLLHWRNDEYWRRQDWYRPELERDFSSFQISGWFDDDFPGTRANWALVQNLPAGGTRPHRLLIGPWKHGYNVDRRLNGFSFGADAVRADVGLLKQQWYDQCFGRREAPSGNRVDFFVLGRNEWRSATSWPPAEVSEERWYFTSSGRAASLTTDGTLEREAPTTAATDTWIYDPEDPPTNWMAFEQMASWADVQSFPYDFRDLERRHDVATYTSSPLAEDLTVAGDIHVVLEASTDVLDTDWWAHLSDVHPDGTSVRLSVGLMRARFRHLDDPREHIRGRNYATEKLLSGDSAEVVRYEIALPSIANTFAEGHRIRIAIANAWDNYSFPNSNTGGDEATVTVTRPGTMTVHHGGSHPSYVLLPVLPEP